MTDKPETRTWVTHDSSLNPMFHSKTHHEDGWSGWTVGMRMDAEPCQKNLPYSLKGFTKQGAPYVGSGLLLMFGGLALIWNADALAGVLFGTAGLRFMFR